MSEKRFLFCLLLICAIACLCACGKGSSNTAITLDGKTASVKGTNKASVKIDSGVITIGRAGTYDLSGTGELQLIIDTEDGKAVYLNLNGIDLTCAASSPIWVKKASMVVLNVSEGTQNTITDRHPYSEEDEEKEGEEALPSAAVYSRSPLLLRGAGKLTVNADSYNGISTSDTFTMEGGNVSVTATHHGIKGKDFVVISGGSLNIKCEGDGIKATNTEKPSLGYINITDGNLNINANDEGIYAPSSISVSGGNITVKSKKTAFLTSGQLSFTGGMIDIRTGNEPLVGAKKDFKAEVLITVNGRPYQK